MFIPELIKQKDKTKFFLSCPLNTWIDLSCLFLNSNYIELWDFIECTNDIEIKEDDTQFRLNRRLTRIRTLNYKT